MEISTTAEVRTAGSRSTRRARAPTPTLSWGKPWPGVWYEERAERGLYHGRSRRSFLTRIGAGGLAALAAPAAALRSARGGAAGARGRSGA